MSADKPAPILPPPRVPAPPSPSSRVSLGGQGVAAEIKVAGAPPRTGGTQAMFNTVRIFYDGRGGPTSY